jgi:hypothetical protein
MSAQVVANYFTVIVLAQWIFIAVFYWIDCIKMYRRTGEAYRLARSIGNGKVLVTRGRRKNASIHLTLSSLGLLVGLMASYRWAFLPHPPVDTTIYSMVMTEGVVGVLALCWVLKRNDISTFKRLQEKHEREIEIALLEDPRES